MALLAKSDLVVILKDLGKLFSALPEERIEELCLAINIEWQLALKLAGTRTALAPHKQSARWKRIQQTAKKLRGLLDGFEQELAYEIDRITKHPRAQRAPDIDEIREEMPAATDREVEVILKSKAIFPSLAAKQQAAATIKSVQMLIPIAASGVAFEENLKENTRKADHFRGAFLHSLAALYQDAFSRRPSLRRMGPWCVFVAQILSKLEDHQVSGDAAYKAWFMARSLSPDMPRP